MAFTLKTGDAIAHAWAWVALDFIYTWVGGWVNLNS